MPPNFICKNKSCPSKGEVFSQNSPEGKYCSKCDTKGPLVFVPPSVVAPTTRIRVLTDSNQMDDCPNKHRAAIETLIERWNLNFVTVAEAQRKHDCVCSLSEPASMRIDREGQVTQGKGDVTHARFRLQCGDKTYAGVQIKVEEILEVKKIRLAFRNSLTSKRYCEVYLG